MENTAKKELPKPPVFEGMSQFRPPLCFELVGQTVELCLDNGYDYQLFFKDRKALTFGKAEEEKKEYAYDCLKVDDTTYFVNFEMTGVTPRTGATFVLDTEQSLVTANFTTIGVNPKYPKMPYPRIIFGGIKKADGTVPTIRHGYTTDLVGKAIRWSYGTFAVVHVYSSERYYRLTIAREDLIGREPRDPEAARERQRRDEMRLYEEPGDYIKIKEGIYIFNANEEMGCRERGQGNNLFFLMNLNRMHDVGRSFGHAGDTGLPENYTYGAFGKYYDASDILARESTEYIR